MNAFDIGYDFWLGKLMADAIVSIIAIGCLGLVFGAYCAYLKWWRK